MYSCTGIPYPYGGPVLNCQIYTLQYAALIPTNIISGSLQTLQTSKSAEDSLQKELQHVQSRLEEEVAAHKRDNSANSGQIAELEGTVREEREKRERVELEKERETTQLKEDIDRLSKDLSNNKVSVYVV